MKLIILFFALLVPHFAWCNDVGPFPAEYEEQIQTILRERLVDPYSVRDFNILEKPYKALWHHNDRAYWVALVSFNTKNNVGGYVGLRQYCVFFEAGRAVMLFERDELLDLTLHRL